MVTFICQLIFSPPLLSKLKNLAFNSASWKIQLLCAWIKPQWCLIKMYATNHIWLTYTKKPKKVTLSWAEALYAEHRSFRACGWLKLPGPQAQKPLKRENSSKQTGFLHFYLLVLSPLAVSLGGLALQESHLLLQLSSSSWQNWTGGYSRDQMKMQLDPLVLWRAMTDLGELSPEKPRSCTTANYLPPWTYLQLRNWNN